MERLYISLIYASVVLALFWAIFNAISIITIKIKEIPVGNRINY